MTGFVVWFIGAIIALLVFKWQKDFEFRVNLDNDGMRIVAALGWPIFVLFEAADFVSSIADKLVEYYQVKRPTTKFVAKLGDIYRKYL